MQDTPLENPNREKYAQLRASGKRRKEASKLAGYDGSAQGAHQLEKSRPYNGVAERIAYLQSVQFDVDTIDETFIAGSLAKEAVDSKNKGSERISALKVLADIRKLTGVTQYHEPERLTKAERETMLNELLWHAQRETREAKTIDVVVEKGKK